jgi:hypothetical protein
MLLNAVDVHDCLSSFKRSRAMKATLMALLGAAAVIAASTSGASAQVLNLTGQFQCVQGCVAAPLEPAIITQADWELNLVNEAGIPSRGWIDYPGHIWVDAWNEGAVYSPDGMTIQFDRGTVWERIVALPLPPAPPPPVLRHRARYWQG